MTAAVIYMVALLGLCTLVAGLDEAAERYRNRRIRRFLDRVEQARTGGEW